MLLACQTSNKFDLAVRGLIMTSQVRGRGGHGHKIFTACAISIEGMTLKVSSQSAHICLSNAAEKPEAQPKGMARRCCLPPM